MEVEGKTIKELLKNLVFEMNKIVKSEGSFEKFATKFEVKGRDMKEAIENFAKKIVGYFEKKKAIFEDLEIEIIPSKKWILKCSLTGKIFEKLEKNFKEVKISEFEENLNGWKLVFSVN